MGSGDEISIRRCKWLLDQRHYCYWREDDISEVLSLKQKRPDFLVETQAGTRFFLESKSFEKETILHQIEATTFSLGHMTLQRRVNRLVRDAAEQLQDYANYGLPGMIVLDNGASSPASPPHAHNDPQLPSGEIVPPRWREVDAWRFGRVPRISAVLHLPRCRLLRSLGAVQYRRA